jgi:hypothetical protein
VQLICGNCMVSWGLTVIIRGLEESFSWIEAWNVGVEGCRGWWPFLGWLVSVGGREEGT